MSGKFCYIVLVMYMLLLSSCGNNKRYHIATSHVEPIEIIRFDSLVFQYVHTADSAEEAEIIARSGEFWDIYNRHILGNFSPSLYKQELVSFYETYSQVGLTDKVLQEFSDASREEESLARISARYMALFPERSRPVYQFHLSGLSGKSIVTMDSLVSISIDCYSDNNDEIYSKRYYDYERPMHTRSRIPVDVSEVLLRNAMPSPDVTTLLDAIIYEGRVAYLVAGLMGDNTATAVMGYTDEQAHWCDSNETLVWTTMIEHGDLFATDNITINKYIHPAPFTAPLTQDSPGRVGRWIGWRIIEKYAERENLTPYLLAVDTTMAADILRLSGYNGK